jgi:spore coat protein CotF
MSDPLQCAQLLSEKQILQDSLMSQKHLTDSYNTFAGECVSEQLRNAMLTILDEEHKIQADIFSCMQSHGWYNVEQAQQQKIMEARQKFTSAQ